jgi:CspA family cold shock protein
MLQRRIDIPTEFTACESIHAFDETRLDLELRKSGLDPDGLAQRLEALLKMKLLVPAHAAAPVAKAGFGGEDKVKVASPAAAPGAQLVVSAAGHEACAPLEGLLERAGAVKFFDPGKGYGFFTCDEEQADIMVHISCLLAAGYRTAYQGARIHALVRKTAKGMQAVRVISMDESNATHPSELPQGTHQKVFAESEWVAASVKWYDRVKGFGFICEGPDAPDCFVHADTLRRWGIAPLRTGQVVEMRWGMSGRGRMVAEIRHCEGQPGLPPVH